MSGPLPPYGQPPADEQPPAERSLWPDPTAAPRADPFPPAPPTREFPGRASGQFQPPMPPPIPPDRPAQPPSVTYQPPAAPYQPPGPSSSFNGFEPPPRPAPSAGQAPSYGTPPSGAPPYGQAPSAGQPPSYGTPPSGQPASPFQPTYQVPSPAEPPVPPIPPYQPPVTERLPQRQPSPAVPTIPPYQPPAPAATPIDPNSTFASGVRTTALPPAPPGAPPPGGFASVPTIPHYEYPADSQATTQVGPGLPGQHQPPPGYQPGPAEPGPYAPVPAPVRKSIGKKIAGIAVVLVIIVAVAIFKVGVKELFSSDDNSPNTTLPEITIPLVNPYDRTPAQLYPQGEAGILTPAVTPVAGFTTAQITAALDTVKKAMIAGRLDTKMLVDHNVTPFVSLFATEDRKEVEGYFKEEDFFTFATQLAPGHTLTADPIRVKGTTTIGAEKTTQGVRLLKVKTNYVWVYPFTGALKDPGDHLVIIHDEVEWVFPSPEDVNKNAQGMYLNAFQGYASNMDCALLDSNLIGLGKPRIVPGGSKEDDNAAFDPNHTLNITDTC